MDLDKFREIRGMCKESAMGPWGTGLTALGIAVGAPVATALAFEGVDAVRSALTSKRNFRRMLESNPDLKDEDPKKVRMAFNTIQRLNPGYAADPGISGAYTKLVAPAGGTSTPEMATQLVGGRKAVRDIYTSMRPDWATYQNVSGVEGKDTQVAYAKRMAELKFKQGQANKKLAKAITP